MSTDSMIKSMVRYDEHIKDAEDSLSKIQSCLVEEADRNYLFKKLDCSVAKAEISRSGAARVSISIKQPKDLKIYENVPALIDGVLKATIYANDGKKELGSITFGIPYYELKFGGEERSFPVYWRGEHIPTNFTAEVSAVDLWAIEDWRKK